MAPIYITIDQEKTGRNIASLMATKGIRVKDIQEACGFEKPQAVYKWLHGQTLPSIDNLLILSILFETDMKGILAVSGDALHRLWSQSGDGSVIANQSGDGSVIGPGMIYLLSYRLCEHRDRI